jgi:signal transduction histidine kinase
MRERAEALGAELAVSAASERGTTVRVIVDAQASAATDRD